MIKNVIDTKQRKRLDCSIIQCFFSFQSLWYVYVWRFGCKYSLLEMVANPLIMNKTAHSHPSHQLDALLPRGGGVCLCECVCVCVCVSVGTCVDEPYRIDGKKSESDYFSQIFSFVCLSSVFCLLFLFFSTTITY